MVVNRRFITSVWYNHRVTVRQLFAREGTSQHEIKLLFMQYAVVWGFVETINDTSLLEVGQFTLRQFTLRHFTPHLNYVTDDIPLYNPLYLYGVLLAAQVRYFNLRHFTSISMLLKLYSCWLRCHFFENLNNAQRNYTLA